MTTMTEVAHSVISWWVSTKIQVNMSTFISFFKYLIHSIYMSLHTIYKEGVPAINHAQIKNSNTFSKGLSNSSFIDQTSYYLNPDHGQSISLPVCNSGSSLVPLHFSCQWELS